jgi:hypothetical protein
MVYSIITHLLLCSEDGACAMANLSGDGLQPNPLLATKLCISPTRPDPSGLLRRSSDVNLTDFPVADADVNVSGSSEATVNPSGRLDVDASGASNVYYLDSPTFGVIDTSGSSTVNPR